MKLLRYTAALLPILLLTGQSNSSWAEGPAVIVSTISEKEINANYEIAGRVKAAARVDITSRVSGILQQRKFTEGNRVSKGDALFAIEQAPYKIKVKQAKASLLSAKASLKQAAADLKRNKTLRKSGAASASQLEGAEAQRDQAKAQVLQADAQLEQANLELSYTNISSPLSGKISQSKFSNGNLISNGSVLATVVQTDPIYVEVSVSEKLLLDVRRQSFDIDDQKMIPSLVLSDNQPYQHTGIFDFIDPEVNTSTDSITIRATFPNPDALLLPGEFVRVRLNPKEVPVAITVPQMAVQRDRDGFFVMVVNNDNVVEQRRVTLGEQNGSDWLVVSGLEKGEKVITEGLQKVSAGLTVEATEG